MVSRLNCVVPRDARICECGTADVQSRRHAFAFGAQRARYERQATRNNADVEGLDATHGSELFLSNAPALFSMNKLGGRPLLGLGLFRVQQGLNELRSPAGSSRR
jgi:hypothetical protein